MKKYLYHYLNFISRYYYFVKIRSNSETIKLHYGCGAHHLDGYLNVDIRWTPAVDIIADLQWCSKYLTGRCAEIYISHVLEHYRYPGKEMRNGPDTVIGALHCCYKALSDQGVLRIAVPDFRAIANLYVNKQYPLFPRLSGRISGEQNYSQNLHRCVFDNEFLEKCLSNCGFGNFQEWEAGENELCQDSSFDSIEGVKTSLNILAKKRLDVV